MSNPCKALALSPVFLGGKTNKTTAWLTQHCVTRDSKLGLWRTTLSLCIFKVKKSESTCRGHSNNKKACFCCKQLKSA